MYDLIIIGAGAAGVFCAYELVKEKTDLKILMIEKGYPLNKRKCPKNLSKNVRKGFMGVAVIRMGNTMSQIISVVTLINILERMRPLN